MRRKNFEILHQLNLCKENYSKKKDEEEILFDGTKDIEC